VPPEHKVGGSNPSGRAISKDRVFSIASVDSPSFVLNIAVAKKESIIRGSHVLTRLMRFFFIAFRLALTSFFTKVVGTGLPFGKLTMAFVVA
jgi:hypothetical protein